MPFLPFVLLIAWQALSRSASFALGWATSLFFGQVPGNKGRILSIMALVSAAWVVVVVGFAIPLGIGWGLERAGVISRNFDLDPFEVWALVAAIGLVPAALAALSEIAEFDDGRSFAGWLRKVPISYPATASLGVSVVQMVLITPFMVFDRMRHGRRLLEVPLVLDRGDSAKGLSHPVADALGALGLGTFKRSELTGPISWPLRTVGFAARHLLGRVVRGDPIMLRGDDLQVILYSTNVGILGTEGEAHRARAAIERQLAFTRAYLTWSRESQAFEDKLGALYRARQHGGLDGDLDRLQDTIDAAPIPLDEWNLLYRLRLQMEREAQDSDTVAQEGAGDVVDG